MKPLFIRSLAACVFCASQAHAETTYTNFIRQVQFPTKVQKDVNVEAFGAQDSALAIDPGGARFDLYTVSSDGPKSYLLKSCYVGTYIPTATVKITSEDTTTLIPQTRADRPFYVDVFVDGIRNGPDDPLPSKSVKFLRHVQSYGVAGTGINLDRTQATLHTQSSISTQGDQPKIPIDITSVPGDSMKIRGEERFSIYSLADYQAPEAEIASATIKIWPVADGAILGIKNNDQIRMSFPKITFIVNDVYPGGTIQAQVYKGEPVEGKTGEIIAQRTNPWDTPQNFDISTGDKYDSAFTEDGRWTLQLINTSIPSIGPEVMKDTEGRDCIVTFEVDRSMKMNGSFTTIE